MCDEEDIPRHDFIKALNNRIDNMDTDPEPDPDTEAVRNTLRDNDSPATIDAIVEETGLSKGTVNDVIDRELMKGIVLETEDGFDVVSIRTD